MWQDVVVYGIGVATFGYVGYRVYNLLRNPSKGGCCCQGCKRCDLGNQKK